jgi:diguanylate cyclase (GGDEF)-like protein/PAS domain S-box-containing protein
VRTYDPDPKSLLPAVRYYFYLLAATIVLLSLFLVGYLYWLNNLGDQLEEVANHYHLETILYCTRIKEEMTHFLPTYANSQFYIQRSSGQGRQQKAYANSVYLLVEYTRTISELHGTYRAASSQAASFEPIIRKANRQLTRIKALPEAAGITGMNPAVKSEATLLASFAHSIEQLRRLHTIARNEANSDLNALKDRASGHILMLFTVVLLLGSLVAWKILRGIRHLVEEQRQTEATLRQSAAVFEYASEGVVIADIDTKIIAVNQAFIKITGYSEKEVLGKNPSILKSGEHDREFYKAMWTSILQSGEWRGEISGRRKNGEIFPKWQTISTVRDHAGRPTHYVSVFSDISHIKESEERLHHLAHHDSLTGLPNRLLLNARLDHSIQLAHRKGTNVAVLFLDLDDFKKVNDSLGHPVGDHLLQLVAKRLLVSARKEDTVARLGGDELAIVLGSMGGARYAATVAQAILDRLSEPFELEEQDVFVSASIGISIYPHDGRDATALLKNADAAMYMAKNKGRNSYHFYSKELTMRARKHLSLETDLYRALEREELLLHFQPQVSLQSGQIVGVEALVRWQHPEIGLVPPAEFIPLAEENGLIGAIGKWVMRTACAQAKIWQDDGLTPFRIAVNISERQLRQTGIVQEIRDILEETGLDPCYLELELTESCVMKKAERALKKLNALRKLGITIAIDDFGTGFSSLSYLKRFPVDRLKIDRSFVHDMPQDANDVAIARAVITLGHSLNLSVVAEGVETQAQRDLLISIGCDEMQGFLYSAPRSASELLTMLTAPTRPACIND